MSSLGESRSRNRSYTVYAQTCSDPGYEMVLLYRLEDRYRLVPRQKEKEIIQSSKTAKRRVVGVCGCMRKLNEPSLLPRLKFLNRLLNGVAVFDAWFSFLQL